MKASSFSEHGAAGRGRRNARVLDDASLFRRGGSGAPAAGGRARWGASLPAREARAFAAVAWSAFVLASVRGPFVAAGLGSGGWFGCVRRVPFSAQHVIIRNGGRLNAGAAGEAELRKLGLADAPPRWRGSARAENEPATRARNAQPLHLNIDVRPRARKLNCQRKSLAFWPRRLCALQRQRRPPRAWAGQRQPALSARGPECPPNYRSVAQAAPAARHPQLWTSTTKTARMQCSGD